MHTPTDTPAAKPAKTRSPRKISWGERLFDWITYAGIGGVGVFIVTAPIAYIAKYGVLAKPFKTASTWLQGWGASADTAEQILMTTATMQGGNVMIPVIKMAENRKVEMVECLNKMVGDTTDTSTLKDAPEQTWGSLATSRFLAWSAVFASFMTAAHFFKPQFKSFKEGFAEKAFCRPLGLPLKNEVGENSSWFNFGKIAAIDVFATTAATILLYTGSRFLAVTKKHKPVAPQEEPAPLPACEPVQPPAQDYAKPPEEQSVALHREMARRSKQEQAPSLTAAL